MSIRVLQPAQQTTDVHKTRDRHTLGAARSVPELEKVEPLRLHTVVSPVLGRRTLHPTMWGSPRESSDNTVDIRSKQPVRLLSPALSQRTGTGSKIGCGGEAWGEKTACLPMAMDEAEMMLGSAEVENLPNIRLCKACASETTKLEKRVVGHRCSAAVYSFLPFGRSATCVAAFKTWRCPERRVQRTGRLSRPFSKLGDQSRQRGECFFCKCSKIWWIISMPCCGARS
eukprot:Skav203828  [mRNA]  locus=scaffold505:269481:277117:- [translate_table: standard]